MPTEIWVALITAIVALVSVLVGMIPQRRAAEAEERRLRWEKKLEFLKERRDWVVNNSDLVNHFITDVRSDRPRQYTDKALQALPILSGNLKMAEISAKIFNMADNRPYTQEQRAELEELIGFFYLEYQSYILELTREISEFIEGE